MPTERRSCASQLHKMQKDFGLTRRELKEAVKEVARPREVKLPVFHEKRTKQDKLRDKLEKKGKKQRRYEIAYWYLEEFLDPSRAWFEYYMVYSDFKELIQHAYDDGIGTIQIMTYVVETDIDPFTIFPDPPEDELDIPEIHWKEFEQYCKTHPLRGGAKDIFPRRERFKKYLRKKRGRYYNKKRMRMYDPLFAMTVVDEKEVVKNLERITRENEIRVKKFHEMLDSLVEDKSIGSLAMKKFDKQTDEILKRHRKRLKSFMDQMGHKPTPLILDFDDDPRVIYDG